jgi:hypothetical protein
MQPEELTELLDEDLEMWAQGGTRILPKSELQRQKPDSLPPVAYPSSVPPPPVAATSTSGAPVWAALIGMAAVFFLAAAGGGIFYALHRAANNTESAASTSEPTVAATTTSEPQQVTLTTTSDPVVTTIAPTATATQKVTPSITSPQVQTQAPVVRYGTIQTFAVGTGKPVFLDGKQIGTGGSRIKAACGKHAVSVGSGKAKTVDIPCNNGTPFTVGTPDGV